MFAILLCSENASSPKLVGLDEEEEEDGRDLCTSRVEDVAIDLNVDGDIAEGLLVKAVSDIPSMKTYIPCRRGCHYLLSL